MNSQTPIIPHTQFGHPSKSTACSTTQTTGCPKMYNWKKTSNTTNSPHLPLLSQYPWDARSSQQLLSGKTASPVGVACAPHAHTALVAPALAPAEHPEGGRCVLQPAGTAAGEVPSQTPHERQYPDVDRERQGWIKGYRKHIQILINQPFDL